MNLKSVKRVCDKMTFAARSFIRVLILVSFQLC